MLQPAVQMHAGKGVSVLRLCAGARPSLVLVPFPRRPWPPAHAADRSRRSRALHAHPQLPAPAGSPLCCPADAAEGGGGGETGCAVQALPADAEATYDMTCEMASMWLLLRLWRWVSNIGRGWGWRCHCGSARVPHEHHHSCAAPQSRWMDAALPSLAHWSPTARRRVSLVQRSSWHQHRTRPPWHPVCPGQAPDTEPCCCIRCCPRL